MNEGSGYEGSCTEALNGTEREEAEQHPHTKGKGEISWVGDTVTDTDSVAVKRSRLG